MQPSRIDGVPVLLTDGPPPFTAGLVFGVGRRDESFVHGGITHLVEHLAMAAVGRTVVDANASVDLTTTEFTAAGTPDQVAAFLESVCRALADLPVDRLAVEADVLRAEGGSVAPPGVAVLLGELYGATTFGLAAAPEPALRSLTGDDVRAWAARWFVRQNAALWVSGPGVGAIRLPLADGPAPVREAARSLPVSSPAWTGSPLDDRITLGALVTDEPALSATLEVLRLRVEEELRHRRGIAYAVGTEQVAIGPDRTFVALSTDVRDGQASVAAEVLWRQVQRLAGEGPDQGEIDHQRSVLAESVADPRWSVAEARSLARAAVRGLPPVTTADLLRDAAALTPQALQECARRLRAAALLSVPEESAPAGLQQVPAWSTELVDGVEHRPGRRSGAPDGARLVVGDTGVSVVLGTDEQVTVRWTDAVGLVREGPDELRLYGRDGFAVPLVAADWRDGAAVLARASAEVPAGLQVTADQEGGGVLLLLAPPYRVREAVGMTRTDAVIVTNERWTGIVVDDEQAASDRAVELAGVAGRRTVALLLRQGHADVDYVLLRAGVEVDRHRWGGAPGDAALLAELTDVPEEVLAGVLAADGTPDEVVARVVTALGLPGEVVDLLAGRDVATVERVAGRGALAGFRSAMRGDSAPPPGSGNWADRWFALSNSRPGWYRAANAVSAVALAVLTVRLLTVDGELTGWRIAGAVVCAGLLFSSLRDVRRAPAVARDGGHPAR
ncbi:insulinase family protein [Modestobacter muralis]|uniref:Insulinase family protein n=1 Tax=Modestobacter muralis TaxID=1608614 RepID=A0A6P0H9J2_9ACTN|nr:insulinase family protein [Modestobacter muralis]NEK95650.1 insulinase family protein [Modestobacter muralis]NEN52538.1 insulinase family protein [Modestobacter muralis]